MNMIEKSQSHVTRHTSHTLHSHITVTHHSHSHVVKIARRHAVLDCQTKLGVVAGGEGKAGDSDALDVEVLESGLPVCVGFA